MRATVRPANDKTEASGPRSEAERVRELSRQFVDEAVHELRTPLTALKEFAIILHEELAGTLSPEQEECFAIIHDCVADLTAMLADMLDLGRLEEDRLRLTRAPGRLEDVIEQVWPGLERRAAANQIGLEVRLDSGLPAVLVDGKGTGRVITNLVAAAIKSSRENGHVTLAAGLAEDGSAVVATVRDEGPGLPPDRREAIAARLGDGSADFRRRTEGLSLGLNMAGELARHGLGRIEVDSEPGCGTVWRFTIPMARTSEDETAEAGPV